MDGGSQLEAELAAQRALRRPGDRQEEILRELRAIRELVRQIGEFLREEERWELTEKGRKFLRELWGD